VLVLSGISACGGDACPEGSIDVDGRCLAFDAGALDAGRADAAGLDGGPVGTDAPLPDVYVPEGVDAGELPDVFVALPDAAIPPDACVPMTFYTDGDGDGHGDPAAPITTCSMPSGAATLSDDCNDAAMAIHPGATEACDGVDQDCDGRFDEGSGPIGAFFVDADGDGHGAIGGASVMACAAPPGRAAIADDCNDGAPGVYPGAPELCSGVDEDCDHAIDESIQRLLRTPHEVVPTGGVTFDFASAAPLADGYALAYQTSSGPVARHVRRDGTTLGSPVAFGSTSNLGPTIAATGPSRVAVFYSRNVSGLTYANYAVSVDFATEPPTVGPEIMIATATNSLGVTSAALEGRLLVSWTSSSVAYGRTYALDLTDPSPVATLFSFSTSWGFVAGEGSTWVFSSGTRPGTSRDDCYLQRLTVSPLAVGAEVITLGDGSAECFAFAGATSAGHAQALLSYAAASRMESVELTLGASAAIVRRATVASTAIVGPFGTTFPGFATSGAGSDFTYGTAPDASTTVGQWIHLDGGASLTGPSPFGTARYISSLSMARQSSQHGVIVYVATPTGGGASHGLWIQEMGCE
jgi:hypothetical protein